MSKDTLNLWQRLKSLFISSQAAHPSKNHLDELAMTATPNQQPLTPKPKTATLTGIESQSLKVNSHEQMINAAFDDEENNHPTEFADSSFLENTTADMINAQQIEQLLSRMGYQFLYHPASDADEQSVHHYTMQVSDKEHQWGCMIRYFSEQQLIAVYSILPTPVPVAYRSDMLAVLAYLNYDLMIGNLELDVMDGELRFKTSLDLEVTGVNELVLSYLIQSNFSLFSRLYDSIDEILQKPNPSHDLQTAIDELVFAQQSNNYLLVTEAMQ